MKLNKILLISKEDIEKKIEILHKQIVVCNLERIECNKLQGRLYVYKQLLNSPTAEELVEDAWDKSQKHQFEYESEIITEVTKQEYLTKEFEL